MSLVSLHEKNTPPHVAVEPTPSYDPRPKFTQYVFVFLFCIMKKTVRSKKPSRPRERLAPNHGWPLSGPGLQVISTNPCVGRRVSKIWGGGYASRLKVPASKSVRGKLGSYPPHPFFLSCDRAQARSWLQITPRPALSLRSPISSHLMPLQAYCVGRNRMRRYIHTYAHTHVRTYGQACCSRASS